MAPSLGLPEEFMDSASSPIHRRDFLKTTALAAGALGLSAPRARARSPQKTERVILMMLTGGPSQLETFDPKPDAPSDVRGPFGTTATRIPGVRFSEHLPGLASLSDKLAIVRSVYHHDAPIHETGMQLLQTGQLAKGDVESPHVFARGDRPWHLLPGIPGPGQTSGPEFLAPRTNPVPAISKDLYGYHPLGRACYQARRLIEMETPHVVVNMFTTLYDKVTWDCHADGYCLNSTLEDYRRTLCPMLDQALTALITDLEDSGLLDSTLVVAMGEMGRTPHLNNRGGRDHSPSAWSMLLAGGGVHGGKILGSTDALGGEPRDIPIHASAIASTIAQAIGVRMETPSIWDLLM